MTVETIAWRALALQVRCDAVNQLDAEQSRTRMRDTISRVGRLLMSSKGFVGPDVRLVVLPEYFLTGFPMGESIEAWSRKAALAIDGPEYDALSELAEQAGVYLSGNVYEVDPAFPDLYFQASFLIDPAGEVVLRYRRLISMFAPTPHDVWDAYLDRYGLDGVFPVADTPLGRFAAIASEEILYPELARTLALRGAEVFLHSTSEVGSPELTPKEIARRARALENSAYIVSANSAGITGIDFPSQSTDGMSKIVDFHGHVLCEAGYGESMVANSDVDVSALRRWRRRPGMGNLLSRQRDELFRPLVDREPIHSPNTMLDENGRTRVPDRAHFVNVQREAIRRLIERGVI